MGRKSKLTKELIEKAAVLIEMGNYQKHVAQALGVSEETWYRWLREGERAKNGLKRQFYESIKKAEGRAIARHVSLIHQAAQNGNWQAAAWLLERRYPQEWGRKDKFDFSSDGNLRIEIVKIDAKEEK